MTHTGRRIWCGAWAWASCCGATRSNCPAASSNGLRWAGRWRRAHHLLLADEPTGSLDETTGAEVLQLLLELLDDSPTSLLMVTHSPGVAARLAEKALLSGGRLADASER